MPSPCPSILSPPHHFSPHHFPLPVHNHLHPHPSSVSHYYPSHLQHIPMCTCTIHSLRTPHHEHQHHPQLICIPFSCTQHYPENNHIPQNHPRCPNTIPSHPHLPQQMPNSLVVAELPSLPSLQNDNIHFVTILSTVKTAPVPLPLQGYINLDPITVAPCSLTTPHSSAAL